MSTKYSSNGLRTRTLQVLAVILVIIFVISAALFFIDLWEKKNGSYSGIDSGSLGTTVEYDGKTYVLKDNVETMLILGLDKYEGEDTESYNNDKQADFLMLLVVDNENSSYTALQINRDTVTEMNVLGVAGDKVGTVKKQIALAHTYGDGKEVSCRNTATAVGKLLLNAEIDHYVSVTLDAVPVYNDLVGGVELTVMDDFSAVDESLVEGEKVTLMGEQALTYVRSRKELEDSTNSSRMERQRQYLNALYSKTKECIENDDSFIEQSFLKMTNYLVSDCSVNKLQAFTTKLSGYEFVEICDIDGDIVKGETFMEFYPDEEALKETAIKLFYKPQD